MSFFGKIFKGKSNLEVSGREKSEAERGKYMPDVNTPADERFTKNFIYNGGKFLYCLSLDEIQESFDHILLENDWYESEVYCTNEQLQDSFKGYNLEYGKKAESAFFLTTCESLVADNGSILVCSKQLKDTKLNNLPKNVVVYATTSQIVNNIGEGLRAIKKRNAGSIPTNITTIKCFESDTEEKDFMSYGSSTKNLYLLLLEDL